MNLYLVRHAMAQNTPVSINDFKRKLTLDGVKQAELLKDYLMGVDFNEIDIYISRSFRTKHTAKIALPNFTKKSWILNENLYLATHQYLLKFINQLNTSRDIFVLGHNDGISSLASYLTGQYIALNTASCVLINFKCENSIEISGATGNLISFFNPVLK